MHVVAPVEPETQKKSQDTKTRELKQVYITVADRHDGEKTRGIAYNLPFFVDMLKGTELLDDGDFTFKLMREFLGTMRQQEVEEDQSLVGLPPLLPINGLQPAFDNGGSIIDCVL